MEKYSQQLPADPLAKSAAVVGISDCFLTRTALRRYVEELEAIATNSALAANEKETARNQLLGNAVISGYGGCSLSLSTNSEVPSIEPCIRPAEECPLRYAAIEKSDEIIQG